MKNNFKLFRAFFRGNVLKILALFIITVSIGIILSTSWGAYAYVVKSVSFYKKADIANSDYVRIYSEFSDRYMYMMEQNSENTEKDVFVNENETVEEYSLDTYNEDYSALVNYDVYAQIEKLSAVENVYYYYTCSNGYNQYNNSDYGLICASEKMYKLFDYPLSNGNWFWDTKEEAEYPNVVVCGSLFENVSVGSNIDIVLNTLPYTVHVVGKVASPYEAISFTGVSDRGLIAGQNLILTLDDEKTVGYFGEQIVKYPSDAIVAYKESATAEEIEECRQFYESFFQGENEFSPYDLSKVDYPLSIYVTTSDMERQSKISVDTLPFSPLLFVAAGIMFVILGTLIIKKKQHDYFIYYFCGCSKKKSFAITAAGIFSVIILAGIICSAFIVYMRYQIANGMVTLADSHYVYDIGCHIWVWTYFIVMGIIACIVPFAMIFSKRSSLLKLYKKEKSE